MSGEPKFARPNRLHKSRIVHLIGFPVVLEEVTVGVRERKVLAGSGVARAVVSREWARWLSSFDLRNLDARTWNDPWLAQHAIYTNLFLYLEQT